jgi:hypothetical protein
LRHRLGGRILDPVAITLFLKREEIVSVVVILLMFLAVIAMVKRVDEDRQRHTILASDSREVEDAIRAQNN